MAQSPEFSCLPLEQVISLKPEICTSQAIDNKPEAHLPIPQLCIPHSLSQPLLGYHLVIAPTHFSFKKCLNANEKKMVEMLICMFCFK